MMETITAQLAAFLEELPFLLLQAAAVVGLLSGLLLLRRDIALEDPRYEIYYGIIFGIAGFLLSLLVAEFLKLQFKPYIRSDILFLAGLMGGWQGGLICLGLMTAGRYLFGGPSLFFYAFIDMSVVTACGFALHGWMRGRPLTALNLQAVLLVFAVRLPAGLLATSAMYALNMVSASVFHDIIGRRSWGSSVTLAMIGCIFFLLRNEARAREDVRLREAAALADSLTGLPNRRALSEHLETVLKGQPARSCMIALVELVNIAEIVAFYGEEWTNSFWPRLAQETTAGQTGRPLASCQPRCFMFSDATLAIVMQGPSTQTDEGIQMVMRLHEGLTAFFMVNEVGPIPQLKTGAADLDARSLPNASAVFRYLSLALRGSENPVQIFPFSFAEKVSQDEWIRQELVEWIKTAAPPLLYQPKVDMGSRRVIGAEALLRARDARGGALSPFSVLEIAERHRLLVEFEWSTIEAVVRDLRLLCGTADIGADFHLAVNISASSFAIARFGERVVACLAAMAVPAHRLTIEVTEMSRMPSLDIVQQNFDALSKAGVRLSLDDFGTGYAALTLLARFPFAEVKIDHWMTARLDQARFKEAIALSFESAQRYGARLVAEGIETERQGRLLMQMGIEYAQGFLYSGTVPLDELIRQQRAPLAGAPVFPP